jgi:hypothetical protein
VWAFVDFFLSLEDFTGGFYKHGQINYILPKQNVAIKKIDKSDFAAGVYLSEAGRQVAGRQAIDRQAIGRQATERYATSRQVLGREANIWQKYCRKTCCRQRRNP